MCVNVSGRESGRGHRWDAGAVWAAASIGFSALLYLVDFGTNISALRTYYRYAYQCPHAALHSSLLREPICRAIRAGQIHDGYHAFWVCLMCLVVALLTYALVFWLTLDPRQHPFRLAYFLPLINVHRLLKLLSHKFNRKDLQELLRSQEETSSLFNAIGASAETAPQFTIQFAIAMKIGTHSSGSLDPYFQAQKIPTILIVSRIISLLSGPFTTSLAVLPLIKKPISLVGRACFGFLTGLQTLAAILAKAMTVAILSKYSNRAFLIPVLIFTSIEVAISWIFIDLVLQRHQPNGHVKNKCLRVAHSFGLALMTRLVGPIYVIVKFSKSSCSIVWGTIAHVLVELLGFIVVSFLPRHIDRDHEPPTCYDFHTKTMKSLEVSEYFTCKALLATFFTSLFIIILTAPQLFCLQSGICVANSSGDVHKRRTFAGKPLVNGLSFQSGEAKDNPVSAFFPLVLFVVWILFIQKLQKQQVL